MKKVVHKLMALAALVGMGLPVVQAQAQEQPNVLPVVSLVPKDATPRIGRNALVKINLVGADNVVHKSLYYTSFNTVDITLGQVASLLGSSYDIELAPRGRESERDLFSDWDIRREQSTRESAHEMPQRTFQRSSDVSRNRQVDATEDNELDTPPFFRKRHRG